MKKGVSVQLFAKIFLVFIIGAAFSLGGCSVSIPHRVAYNGEIAPNQAVENGYVTIETKFIQKDGGELDGGYPASLMAALTDALHKHHISTEKSPELVKYTLVATVDMRPDMALWKYAPQTGKNIALAAIPIAGAFTPRFYKVSTGFRMKLMLSRNGEVIDQGDYLVKDEKVVKVSNIHRQKESVAAAVAIYEKNRDAAIGKFFLDLGKKFPLQNAKS